MNFSINCSGTHSTRNSLLCDLPGRVLVFGVGVCCLFIIVMNFIVCYGLIIVKTIEKANCARIMNYDILICFIMSNILDVILKNK